MPLYCPIFPNEQNPCNNHSCLFYRNEGCAIVLAATISDENRTKIAELNQKIDNLNYDIQEIKQKLFR